MDSNLSLVQRYHLTAAGWARLTAGAQRWQLCAAAVLEVLRATEVWA